MQLINKIIIVMITVAVDLGRDFDENNLSIETTQQKQNQRQIIFIHSRSICSLRMILSQIQHDAFLKQLRFLALINLGLK